MVVSASGVPGSSCCVPRDVATVQLGASMVEALIVHRVAGVRSCCRSAAPASPRPSPTSETPRLRAAFIASASAKAQRRSGAERAEKGRRATGVQYTALVRASGGLGFPLHPEGKQIVAIPALLLPVLSPPHRYHAPRPGVAYICNHGRFKRPQLRQQRRHEGRPNRVG
eukprot:2031139-Pleurochrysis_carterae.AAC.6